jgi:hypothetical protein
LVSKATPLGVAFALLYQRRVLVKGKKYVGLIFLLVCIAMVGYVGFSIYTQVQADIAEWKATTWFVFRNDIDSFDGAEYVTVEELMDYEVKTDVYNPKVYYASLNEREQLAYKAFQYALDNNFIYTFIVDFSVFCKRCYHCWIYPFVVMFHSKLPF